jgi:hypothetical protein
LQLEVEQERIMQEIMSSQRENRPYSEDLSRRVRQLGAEAKANVQRLRNVTFYRLGRVSAATQPAHERAQPSVVADDDVIEAEIIDDGDTTPGYDSSSVVLSGDDEVHRDYMELFSMTDPAAAREKLAEIQQKERARLAAKTRGGLASTGLIPTKPRGRR